MYECTLIECALISNRFLHVYIYMHMYLFIYSWSVSVSKKTYFLSNCKQSKLENKLARYKMQNYANAYIYVLYIFSICIYSWKSVSLIYI